MDYALETWNGNLSYISLGFPLQNAVNEVLDQKKKKLHWGMNFTLIPFSNVDYNIETKTDEMFGDTLTSVDYTFEGKGGTYKVLWGNSVAYKNFSAGINLGYFFGKIENDKFVAFPDLRSAYNNVFQDDFTVSGFTWNIGVQQDFVTQVNETSEDPVKYFTVGVTANSRNKFNIRRDRFWRTQNFAYPISNQDTILSVTGEETFKSEGFLPGEVGVGFMYTHLPYKTRKSLLRLGVDFKYQQWSEFVNDLVAAGDVNQPDVSTWRLSFGGEYQADERSYNNYFKKIRYRFGAFYNSDPRTVTNEQLRRYGFTFGFGMPIVRPQSERAFVNIGFELGKIGLADSLDRNYFRINLGFTLNDKYWFQQIHSVLLGQIWKMALSKKKMQRTITKSIADTSRKKTLKLH